jgi:CheY-like chemotaxis protein
MAKNRAIEVLLSDDDDGHAELIKETLRDSGLTYRVTRFSDGIEFWKFLSGENVSGNRINPDKSYIIILDVNIPKMDGIELLEFVKKDPNLCRIPVIILTTTDDPSEVEKCYRHGCSFYIIKPIDFAQFAETLHRLGLFLQIVQA